MTRDKQGNAPLSPISAGLAAILGGVSAAAAIWMWYSARARPQGLAHRADGTDDSASLTAGIADEGMIPDIDLPMAPDPGPPESEAANAGYPPHFPDELVIPARN